MAIAKVFFDQDMRLGLPGLRELMEKKRIRIKSTDFAMFVNKNQNKVKILWANQYLLMVGKERGKLSIDDLKLIPTFFRGEFLPARIEAQILKHIDRGAIAYVDEEGLKAS